VCLRSLRVFAIIATVHYCVRAKNADAVFVTKNAQFFLLSEMSLYLEFLFEWFGRNDNTTFPISHPDQVNKFKHAIERKTNIREK